MLSVFKKYQGWLIICECIIAVFATALIADGVGWHIIIAFVLSLSLIAFVVMDFIAGLMHQRLLGILYVWQKPKEFIVAYEPLTQQKDVRKNVLFSMCAYLSNAHAALGEFDTALLLLDNMPKLSRRRQLAGQALVSGNKCNFYLEKGDLENAQEEYNKLIALKDNATGNLHKELESTAELLDIKLTLAKGACGELDAYRARELYKKSTSALHKTQLRFLLGQIYLQLGRSDLALEYLKEVVKAEENLWVVKQANILLSKCI